jgi:hypothetical protein
MLRTLGLLGLLVLAPFLPGRTANAQEADGQVLPPGMVRITFGGRYQHLGREFAPGGTQPLGGALGGRLDAERLEGLATLRQRLGLFFDATGGGFQLATEDLVLGALEPEFAWSTRIVPVELSIGILPRVEFAVSVSALRDERLTRRFALSPGVLGLNPDTARNVALLRAVGEPYAAIGTAPFLPLADSRAGRELSNRVERVTGSDLALPTAPARLADLVPTLGLVPPPHYVSAWRPGDVELEARVEVLRTFADDFVPRAGEGVNLRLTALGALRLPTGEQPSGNVVLDWAPRAGVGAAGGGAIMDLFLGDRGWITVGSTFRTFSAATVRLAPPGSWLLDWPNAIAVEGEVTPGSELVAWGVPRLRLTREISVEGRVRHERRGVERRTIGGSASDLAAASLTAIGGSFRYTTFGPFQEAGRPLPMDVTFGYTTDIAGPQGTAARSTAFVELSLARRLWGR